MLVSSAQDPFIILNILLEIVDITESQNEQLAMKWTKNIFFIQKMRKFVTYFSSLSMFKLWILDSCCCDFNRIEHISASCSAKIFMNGLHLFDRKICWFCIHHPPSTKWRHWSIKIGIKMNKKYATKWLNVWNMKNMTRQKCAMIFCESRNELQPQPVCDERKRWNIQKWRKSNICFSN